MKKIFKYPFENNETYLPKGARVIRVDEVHDSQYSGKFCWAIVDTEEKITEHFVGYKWFKHKAPFDTGYRIQLRVKERQFIEIEGTPISAGEEDGNIFVYYVLDGGEKRSYEIVLYKTGQEITDPVDNLRYLGLNRLWIVMELGLYTFVVEN